MAGVTQRTVFRLRERVDQKIGRLPLAYFDRESRGDILSRVTNDIDNISQTLQQTLTQLITSLFTVIGVLILMVSISPLLALISLLVVPASIIVTALIATRSQKQFAAQWRARCPERPRRGNAYRPRHRQSLWPAGGRPSRTSTA
jgi:ATP-binding cassette subfamily B protein